MQKPLLNIPKILLETALENNGIIRGCPIEYNRKTDKWVFWNEDYSKRSLEYDCFDDAVEDFTIYCEKYMMEQGNTT